LDITPFGWREAFYFSHTTLSPMKPTFLLQLEAVAQDFMGHPWTDKSIGHFSGSTLW
jgi:hypothetical protein